MFIWLGIEKKSGGLFSSFLPRNESPVTQSSTQPEHERYNHLFNERFSHSLFSKKGFLPSTVSHNCWSFLSSNKYTWTVTRKEKLDQTLNAEKVHLRIFRFSFFRFLVFLFEFFDIFLPVDCILRQTEKPESFFWLKTRNQKHERIGSEIEHEERINRRVRI